MPSEKAIQNDLCKAVYGDFRSIVGIDNINM